MCPEDDWEDGGAGGVHTWLSLGNPEMGIQSEAICLLLDSIHFEPYSRDVVVWLPGLWAETAVWLAAKSNFFRREKLALCGPI